MEIPYTLVRDKSHKVGPYEKNITSNDDKCSSLSENVKGQMIDVMSNDEYETLVEQVKIATNKLRAWHSNINKSIPSVKRGIDGVEGLAITLSLAILDKDGDGIITNKEYEAYLDSSKEKLDNAYSQLLNVGVVAALILSMLFPLAAGSPITPSEECEKFFGHNTVHVFLHIYYGLVIFVIAASLVALYTTMRTYTVMGFWITNQQTRMNYLSVSALYIINILAMIIVYFSLAIIPFAMAVTSTPVGALIALVLVFISIVIMVAIEINVCTVGVSMVKGEVVSFLQAQNAYITARNDNTNL